MSGWWAAKAGRWLWSGSDKSTNLAYFGKVRNRRANMSESERERRKREKREQDAKDNEAIRKGQEKKNWDRREKAIRAAADQEAMERLDDEYLDRQFLELFDVDAAAAKEYLDIAQGADPSDKEVQEAIQAIREAAKAKQGGMFTSPNPEKAKRIIKGKQKAIRNTIKKGKAKKGCLGAFVGMAAVGAATLYGMYEGVSAIASSLF